MLVDRGLSIDKIITFNFILAYLIQYSFISFYQQTNFLKSIHSTMQHRNETGRDDATAFFCTVCQDSVIFIRIILIHAIRIHPRHIFVNCYTKIMIKLERNLQAFSTDDIHKITI